MLATRHDYLLHALFAFTALHIAHLRPVDATQYTSLATTYLDKTLQSLSGLLRRADLEPEQVDACFWSSAFVGLITLGQYHQTNSEERQTPKALLLKLASLWRGADTVGKVHVSTISTTNYHGRHTPTPGATSQTAFGGILLKYKSVSSRMKTTIRTPRTSSRSVLRPLMTLPQPSICRNRKVPPAASCRGALVLISNCLMS